MDYADAGECGADVTHPVVAWYAVPVQVPMGAGMHVGHAGSADIGGAKPRPTTERI